MTNRISLSLIIAVFVLLSWNGIGADMPLSRAPSETEQVKFAVKFGSGDLNPKHFLHPPFFAYILFGLYSIAFLIGKAAGIFHSVWDYQRLYFTDPSMFYLIARYAVLAISAAGLAVFYFAAAKLFDKRCALIAVFFTALSPLYVKLAHYAAPDMPMFFLAMASSYFAVRIFREGRISDYIFSGLALGIALATKYGAAFMMVPILAAHLLSESNKGSIGRLFDKKLIILFAFIAAGLFIGNPFMFLDHQRFLGSFSAQGERMSAASYNFASWKADKAGWLYIITDTMPFGLGGYIPTVSILAGIAYSAYRRRKEDLIVLTLILATFLSVGRWSVIKPRYFIYVFPFAYLLLSRFLVEIVERTALSKKSKIYILAGFMALILIQPVMAVMNFEALITAKPVYVQAKDWMESNVPAGEGVVTFTRVPLVPNEASINRSLKKISEKKMGEGMMLKAMLKHMKDFSKVYDIYELPYPWREDFDGSEFDFNVYLSRGVKYFIITEEAEEYYADPVRYTSQVAYMDAVKKHCRIIAEFKQARPRIEPGYISDNEYVQIYRRGPA